ncbi:MAG TPA: ATP-binding protein [Kofleriaceae bacterium]|nr:ATP-binding protein [Kofleriaceae bacterium]
MNRARHLGLQWKLTVALVLIVLLPLVASAMLIDQIGKVAANFGATEARERGAMIEQVSRVYRDLVSTTKALQVEVAQRIASRPDIAEPVPGITLHKILDEEANLRAIAVLRPDGTVLDEAAKPTGAGESKWRDAVVDHQLPSGASLRLTFRVIDTSNELQALKTKLDAVKQFAQERSAFGGGLQTAFLVVMALAALAAVGFGLFAGSFVTRRIAALVTTARRVSDGHHDARVELRGKDEMAELGSAFNTMLDDLEHARGQLEYLQRMGVWQDVARKLAHEIKNPLTPIQLAVQQTVSTYKGDDVRFKKQLQDMGEIVEEEIAGLRRLVDTFRTLGQLPKVEKAPIALAELIEELKLDPAFATKLELRAPGEPVTVRADKLLLKRVLANLVENGIHAGQEAGTDGGVVITWRAEHDTVQITVDDHGKGVADSDRDKIFEPYVTSKATGTGLGLAIARKIAIEHGGDLALASGRAPTGGARFVITLPLRGPEASLA